MQQQTEQPHVIKEFNIGATHIRICDNYCVKTQEDVETILRRVARRVQSQLSQDSAKIP